MFKTYASKEWFDPNNGSRRESRFITYKSVKYITTNSDHSWDPLPLLASPGSGSRIIPSHRVAHSSFNTFFFFSALSFFLRHFFHHSSHRIFFQTSSHEKLVTTHSVNSREYFLIYQNVRPIGLAFESKWINFFPDVMNSFPASKSNIFFSIFFHIFSIFFFIFSLPSQAHSSPHYLAHPTRGLSPGKENRMWATSHTNMTFTRTAVLKIYSINGFI